MNKHSRKHGLMWLSSYSPGDGSIDFVWVMDNDRNGECLSEFVSESDISEWLRSDGQKDKWDGWDIITIGHSSSRHTPSMNRLAKTATRPKGSWRRVVMGGTEYEYVYHGPENPPSLHSSGNTDIYEVEGRKRHKVENVGIILGITYFLNHEMDFKTSGIQTRETARARG